MLSFDEIVGHEQIIGHFRNVISEGKVAHAYILSGEDGSGKMTLANAFALALLCETGNGEPCMQCPSCKQILSGNHPDLIYVTHEKPGSIGVDDIRRQIDDTVSVRPYRSEYKIYIVDEAEKMTPQAQNALLKTLEEPPSYVVILLLTSNEEALLPTVLSRCVVLKLKPLPDEAVRDYLEEKLQVSPTDAAIFASFARGNLGRAIDMAASETFHDYYRTMLDFLKRVKQIDTDELMEIIEKIKAQGYDLYQCLDFMQLWYRDILLYKVTKDPNSLIFKGENAAIRSVSETSSYPGLEEIISAIDKARVRLQANVNPELALELMVLTMKEN